MRIVLQTIPIGRMVGRMGRRSGVAEKEGEAAVDFRVWKATCFGCKRTGHLVSCGGYWNHIKKHQCNRGTAMERWREPLVRTLVQSRPNFGVKPSQTLAAVLWFWSGGNIFVWPEVLPAHAAVPPFAHVLWHRLRYQSWRQECPFLMHWADPLGRKTFLCWAGPQCHEWCSLTLCHLKY